MSPGHPQIGAMPLTQPKSLDADQLRSVCDPAQFRFDTTAELGDPDRMLGQERALEALEFGVGIARDGYNLYALGETGTGRHHLLRDYLSKQAADRPVPQDVCYVFNFDEPHKPRCLLIPPGRARLFKADMEQLVDDLEAALPVAFESDEYQARAQEIHDEFEHRREEAFTALAKEATAMKIRLVRTPGGFAFAPVVDDAVIEPEAFAKLTDEEKQQIERQVSGLQDKLAAILRSVPQWQRDAREKLRSLNREVAIYTVGHLIDALESSYADIDGIAAYLGAVREDIVDNTNAFLGRDGDSDGATPQGHDGGALNRYKVNLLIDRDGDEGAPVVYEDHPLYQNLVGRVEHVSLLGALTTDFTLIKPGALHHANGGFLILDARKLLAQPYAWEGLKRALKSDVIRLESLGEMFSLVSTVTIEPEPVPLDVKVAVVGDRLLYYLLHAYDPEFEELFKVSADFEDRIDRSEENLAAYAVMIGAIARREELLAMDRGGVSRVIEQSAREADHAGKLSTRLSRITDLLHQADHWAREEGKTLIDAAAVTRAIDMRERRADRIRERTLEQILRGTVLIDTEGERVGQLNGLAVLDVADHAFGSPVRITATARIGEGELVDIEREVELGGSLHSKGVFILSAFIAARYAAEQPLSVAASLVFEQSYGSVEGDSASLGELCALLSAMGDIPVRQDLAITGSVNQHGAAQAIGGVNEKIEGFFAVCEARGLTGRQGVIIPASNVQHLMLDADVVDAVREGRFGVYAVHTVDEAMEILANTPAGVADGSGEYPPGTVNRIVADRLHDLAQKRHEFSKPAPGGDDESGAADAGTTDASGAADEIRPDDDTA